MTILIELLSFDFLTEHKYIHYLIPSVYCVKICSLRYFHFHVFKGVIDIYIYTYLLSIRGRLRDFTLRMSQLNG